MLPKVHEYNDPIHYKLVKWVPPTLPVPESTKPRNDLTCLTEGDRKPLEKRGLLAPTVKRIVRKPADLTVRGADPVDLVKQFMDVVTSGGKTPPPKSRDLVVGGGNPLYNTLNPLEYHEVENDLITAQQRLGLSYVNERFHAKFGFHTFRDMGPNRSWEASDYLRGLAGRVARLRIG